MSAKNRSSRARRLCQVAHLSTVAFVIAFITCDFLDGDLSEFFFKQIQIKRVVVMAEAPKDVAAGERLNLPPLRPTPVSTLLFQNDFRFQLKKEIQRTLNFRRRQTPVQRIVYATQPPTKSISPA